MDRPWRLQDERPDAHNTSIDAAAAEEHRCGTIDLRTGRVCRLPEHHTGSCGFAGNELITTDDDRVPTH